MAAAECPHANLSTDSPPSQLNTSYVKLMKIYWTVLQHPTLSRYYFVYTMFNMLLPLCLHSNSILFLNLASRYFVSLLATLLYAVMYAVIISIDEIITICFFVCLLLILLFSLILTVILFVLFWICTRIKQYIGLCSCLQICVMTLNFPRKLNCFCLV